MKKIILSLVAIVSISAAFAQNCNPDPQYTAPGVYPDSATGLPVAVVGVPYAETITAITPVDTCVQIFPAPLPCTVVPIDSVVVDSIAGLPAGFTLVSENENNLKFYFYGGTSSCMLLSGTATAGQVGVYPLYVSGLSWGQVAGNPTSQPFVVDWYQLEIVAATGIETFEKNQFRVEKITPNPFNTVSTISYFLPTADKVTVRIVNVLGEVVKSEMLDGNLGENKYTINAASLSNGVYFYTISYLNESVTKRFIVNK